MLRCAGFNNVDLNAASELGIKVARVPSYSPEAVAEFAVGMIMTVVRKYHKSFSRVREGNFLLDGLLGFNLSGKTVGIVGAGQIGLITGRILSKGFSCNVVGYDPYPSCKAKDHGINYVDTLEELLKQSDILSLHCPLTPGNKYMINDNTLGQTKKGVVLINTSRGGLIDTRALIRSVWSISIRSNIANSCYLTAFLNLATWERLAWMSTRESQSTSLPTQAPRSFMMIISLDC